jgi:hypothetical protein
MDRFQFMVVVLGEFLIPSIYIYIYIYIYIDISGLLSDFAPVVSGR